MKTILILLVNFYKKFISPLFPPTCKYYPSCSTYMIVALRKHGVLLGLIMGIARIIRCNPFIHGGYDPVPDKFSIYRNKRAREQYRRSINLK
ncbi:membrane protein insertion efficiency factor YidD [Apilactobacillus xinyiensis]|uniref:Putative membrane protein insertion efficiency factor n=1 Tax=Apilactobacillus xinyiensis TaxID=2841032 RepID=A0ABT0HZH5_9LACO|nr:membrane protein insertion efficiency factor YidD [Apilactobacillus xinyiensis]MCK8623985.1 membrane protein insertion efficiency factor YidD [Apilactobacillus xinyiensis]MCL0311578.1 membrane protein insertion efficiency factor YidD [Apilactobacillus xinyiensis]MCL0330046.1 membrane protein insertion efficiency factor YidD [Apilactobacillus xinyiensis]